MQGPIPRAMEEHNPKSIRHIPQQTIEIILCVVLFFITLALTWPGLNQAAGLIGEESTRVSIAAQIASTGNLDPYWYGHPATLINYLLALIYKASYALDGQAFTRETYIKDHEQLVTLGRLISRIIAALCAPMIYLMNRTIFPIRWALLATAMTIFNPLFITHSHRARSDHLLTLILLSSGLITASKASIKQKLIPLSILSGLGLTFKYLAASVFASTQLLIGLNSSLTRKQKLVNSLKSVSIFASTILLTSPYLYLRWQTAYLHFSGEVNKKSNWAPLAALKKFLLINAYGYSVTGILLLLGLALMLLALQRSNFQQAVRKSLNPHRFIGIAIIYAPFIGIGFAASTYNSTWLTPALPFVSACITGILKIGVDSTATKSKRALKIVSLITIAAIATSQAKKTWAIHQLRLQNGSTRNAEAWLKSQETPSVQTILFLHPNDSQDAAGAFPRFNRQRYQAFIAAENGMIRRICSNSPYDWINDNPSKHLIHFECFPQPVYSSKSHKTIEELVQEFDFVITSERYRESLPESTEKEIVFSTPRDIVALNYSKFNFPQGDSGAWKTIIVYRRY